MKRLWFYLTVSRRCSWCAPRRIMRHAIFHRTYTDGICKDCMATMRLQLVRPLPAQLPDTAMAFRIGV